jgi:agmatinase
MQGQDFADYIKKVSKQAPYSGEMTFWRLPLSKDLQKVDVAIIGSPFDMSVTNRPGARFGPRGLREQSIYVGLFPTLYPWDFGPKAKFKIIDYGDIQYLMASIDDFLRKSEKEVSDIMSSGASVLGLGGDHLTSLPIIRAISKKHGKLSVVHFDSHTDTYPTEVLTHGTVFYQLMQEDHVEPTSSIQVGIRTPWDDSLGYHVKDVHWVRRHTPEEIAAEIKETVGNNKVFSYFGCSINDSNCWFYNCT